MGIVYEDPETGLAIRPMNLDDKHDIQLLIRANKVFFSEMQRCNEGSREDRFYGFPYIHLMHVAQWMICEHLFIRDNAYVIMRDGKEVGIGWVGEEKWVLPDYRVEYYYPFVGAIQLEKPWGKLLGDMEIALGRMMKKQGYERIYSKKIKGHPANGQTPKKREITVFPLPPREPILEFWELDVK